MMRSPWDQNGFKDVVGAIEWHGFAIDIGPPTGVIGVHKRKDAIARKVADPDLDRIGPTRKDRDEPVLIVSVTLHVGLGKGQVSGF